MIVLRRRLFAKDEEFPEDMIGITPYAVFRKDDSEQWLEVWYLEEKEEEE